MIKERNDIEKINGEIKNKGKGKIKKGNIELENEIIKIFKIGRKDEMRRMRMILIEDKKKEDRKLKKRIKKVRRINRMMRKNVEKVNKEWRRKKEERRWRKIIGEIIVNRKRGRKKEGMCVGNMEILKKEMNGEILEEGEVKGVEKKIGFKIEKDDRKIEIKINESEEIEELLKSSWKGKKGGKDEGELRRKKKNKKGEVF